MSQNKTLQQGPSFETHILFQKMSLSFKKGQFLLVRAVGRNGKGYTMGGVRSLVVDEVNRQISLFKITDGLICTVMALMF